MKNNTTKYAILGLLTIEPLSGYEMKKLIKESLAYFWSESNGQIYPTLNQLLKDHWIVVSNTTSSSKKSTRYAITEQGSKELQIWMQKDIEKSVHRDENLLKLFFGANVPKQESIRRLESRQEKLTEKLNEYQTIVKALEKKSGPHAIYWMMTADYGIRSVQAAIDWCQNCIRILSN